MLLHRVRVSDYPFLCFSYKVASGQDMVLVLHIRGVGWRSIITSPSQQPHFETLGSFWDYSDQENLQDDNESAKQARIKLTVNQLYSL